MKYKVIFTNISLLKNNKKKLTDEIFHVFTPERFSQRQRVILELASLTHFPFVLERQHTLACMQKFESVVSELYQPGRRMSSRQESRSHLFLLILTWQFEGPFSLAFAPISIWVITAL